MKYEILYLFRWLSSADSDYQKSLFQFILIPSYFQ